MVLKLGLEIIKGNILSYNYQYPLSSFIYKTIARADGLFADFLHDEGYRMEGRQFKLFTFSPLEFGKGGLKHIPKSDRFYINNRDVSLELRFFMPKAAEYFIVGLFKNQEFGLGDRLNKIDCRVKNVETLVCPDFNDEQSFKTWSPIMLSIPRENGHAKYLHPSLDKALFEQAFIENLRNKYVSLGNEPLNADIEFSLLDGDVKRQGIKIKAFTDAETQIIPYHFKFKLSAPNELLQLGYLAGFGLENSMGLGCCRLMY